MKLMFSSTKPSAFDTKKIATFKWNQAQSSGVVVGTASDRIQFSSPLPESFATKLISLEKTLQKL